MRVLAPLIFAAGMLAAPPALAAGDDYVIFLHNAWYEKNKAGEPHPKFGAYDFEGIVEALGASGEVTAPVRGPDADPKEAARALADEISGLIDGGRPAATIKVIGASKGGFIVQLASAMLEEPELRWVIVGACHTARLADAASPAMNGRVFAISERSDTVAGTCAQHTALYDRAASFEELEISTGRDHGFQFDADPAWTGPAAVF